MKEEDILYSPEFKRALKPFAKKYHTLRSSLKQLQTNLCDNPYLGEAYGDGIFKVRLSDESKNAGKSGGFRIMYYHLCFDENHNVKQILFLTIFNKSDTATIKSGAAKKLRDRILTTIRFKR